MNAVTGGVDDVKGTSSNDKIVGVIHAALGDANSYDAGDLIDGGDGTDTLSLTVIGDNNAARAIASPVATSIEVLSYTNSSGQIGVDETEIETDNISGLTKIVQAGAGDDRETVISGMTKVVDAEMAGSGVMTLDYTAAAVVGTSDTQKLTLNGTAHGVDEDAIFNSDGDIETLAITTAKASEINITGAGLTKITVAGAAAIDADITAAAVTAIDASASTAGNTITATNIAAAASIKTGAGADLITVVDPMTSDMTVDGGNGNDTLGVFNEGAIAATAFNNVTNVENIVLAGGDNNAVSIDLDDVTTVKTVNFATFTASGDADATTNTVQADNIASGSTVRFESFNLGAEAPAAPATFNMDGQAAATLNVKGAALAGRDSDSLSVNLVNNNNSDIKNTSTDTTVDAASRNAYVIADLIVADVETININSTGTFGRNELDALTTVDASKVVITGDQALRIDAMDVSDTDSVTFDASALTGRLQLTVGSAELANFETGLKGGKASNDTLTVTVAAAAEVATDTTGFETVTANFVANADGSYDYSGHAGATTLVADFTGGVGGNNTIDIAGLSSSATLAITGTQDTDLLAIQGAGATSSLKLVFNEENQEFATGELTLTRLANLTIDTNRVDGVADANADATQAATTINGITSTTLKTLTVVGASTVGDLTLGAFEGGDSILTAVDLSGFAGDLANGGLALDTTGTTKGVTVSLNKASAVGATFETYSVDLTGINAAGAAVGDVYTFTDGTAVGGNFTYTAAADVDTDDELGAELEAAVNAAAGTGYSASYNTATDVLTLVATSAGNKDDVTLSSGAGDVQVDAILAADDVTDYGGNGLTLGAGSDIVKFGSDIPGDVTIGNFTAGNAVGTNADVLNLSALGISLADLTFTDYDQDASGADDSVVITSTEFDGDIYLAGVLTADLVASNFVF